MNNNRGNNRRRGRGNRQQGGNQQQNRIDNRARGNAPQLLDKYKKLAHDAHLNGDRVQEEYYLQFADHYFRVIADQKARQEEAREKRREDRGQDDRDDNDNADSPEDSENSRDNRSRDDNQRGKSSRNRFEDSGDDDDAYESADNPFVRENRSRGGNRQRKPRRDDRKSANDGNDDDGDEAKSVDPAVLPPSIGANEDGKEEVAAKPKRRTRKQPPADDGEALESVG